VNCNEKRGEMAEPFFFPVLRIFSELMLSGKTVKKGHET